MAIPMRVFSTGIDSDDWIPRRFTQQQPRLFSGNTRQKEPKV